MWAEDMPAGTLMLRRGHVLQGDCIFPTEHLLCRDQRLGGSSTGREERSQLGFRVGQVPP